MMKLRYWLIILGIGSFMQGWAQTKDSAQVNNRPYKTAITFSPLAFWDTDNKVMFGVEHRLSDKWGYAIDAGYIFHSSYMSRSKSAKGMEIRTAARMYDCGSNKRGYFQGQFSYKMVDYTIYDWVGKSIINGQPAYEELQNNFYRKKTFSLSITRGNVFTISKGIFLDMYIGIGLRYKDKGWREKSDLYKLPSDPEGFFHNMPDRWLFILPAGIKLNVAIN